MNHRTKPAASDRLPLVNKFNARDRRFLQELADALHLHLTWDEVDDYGQNLAVLKFDMEGVSEDEGADVPANGHGHGHGNGHGNGDATPNGNKTPTNGAAEGEDGEWESEEEVEEEENESDLAVQRVLGKYEKAKVVDNVEEDFEDSYEEKLKVKMDDWKKGYYKVSLAVSFQLGRIQTDKQHVA